MKFTLSFFVLCFTTFFWSADAQVQIVKDSLSSSKIVGFQKKIEFENYQVKFKKVIADSRCPKNVMCVRAGEAVILVSIYKNGDFLEDRKIRIDASGYVMESTNLAFDAKDFKIYGFSLSPYPTDTSTIDEKLYQLEIVFQPQRPE